MALFLAVFARKRCSEENAKTAPTKGIITNPAFASGAEVIGKSPLSVDIVTCCWLPFAVFLSPLSLPFRRVTYTTVETIMVAASSEVTTGASFLEEAIAE
jgi:hypothetical protein